MDSDKIVYGEFLDLRVAASASASAAAAPAAASRPAAASAASAASAAPAGIEPADRPHDRRAARDRSRAARPGSLAAARARPSFKNGQTVVLTATPELEGVLLRGLEGRLLGNEDDVQP